VNSKGRKTTVVTTIMLQIYGIILAA